MDIKSKIHKEYVYIIRTREAIRANDKVYKIGMTETSITKRLRCYGIYEILMVLAVHKSKEMEERLLEQLSKKYEINKEYGNEYFNVQNINEFINDFISVVNNNIISKGANETQTDSNINLSLSTEVINNENVPLNIISNAVGNNMSPLNITINNILPNSVVVNNSEEKNEDINNLDINLTKLDKNIYCKRCGYDFDFSYKLEKHLNKVKPCKAIINNISIESLRKEFINTYRTVIKDNKKYYRCKYCKKLYLSASSKCSHQKKCKENYK